MNTSPVHQMQRHCRSQPQEGSITRRNKKSSKQNQQTAAREAKYLLSSAPGRRSSIFKRELPSLNHGTLNRAQRTCRHRRKNAARSHARLRQARGGRSLACLQSHVRRTACLQRNLPLACMHPSTGLPLSAGKERICHDDRPSAESPRGGLERRRQQGVVRRSRSRKCR